MKFIGELAQLGSLRRSGYPLNLQTYHKAAVGFLPGVTYYQVAHPFQSGTDSHAEGQLVLCPFKPSSWKDLWRIDIHLREGPGVAHQILDALRRQRINILVQEGLTSRVREVHELHLITDFEEWNDDIDLHSSERAELADWRIVRLRNLLIRDCHSIIQRRSSDGSFGIEIERMRSLYNLYREISEQGGSLSDDLNHAVSRKGEIFLKNKALRQLELPPGELRKADFAVFSDSEEKYIALQYLHPSRTVVHLRIAHIETIGALAKFTEILKDKDANILHSYSRLNKMDEIATWYAVVDISDTLGAKNVSKKGQRLLEGLRAAEIHGRSIVRNVRLLAAVGRWSDDLHLPLDSYRIPVDRSTASLERRVNRRAFGGVREGLKKFVKNHNNFERNIFLMMRLKKVRDFQSLQRCIKKACKDHEFNCVVASDHKYCENIDDNLRVYMLGCKFGITLYEQIGEDDDYFNPNIAYEQGFMESRGRRVLVLKDKKVKKMPFDLLARMRSDIDVDDLDSIERAVAKWLTEIGGTGPNHTENDNDKNDGDMYKDWEVVNPS